MSDPTDKVVTADGVVRSRQEAETLGLPLADPSAVAAEARTERRRKMFDTTEHAATTFVEGAIDAAFLGLLPVREGGDTGDIRRDVNKGPAVAGELFGFGVGMMTGVGPIRPVTRAAEKLGAATAKTLLRSGEASITARAVQEAAASMALAGTQATAHQLSDVLLEDKEFSSEAIIDEVKLAGILGAGGGALLGGLSKVRAKASDIAAQRGLVGDLDEVARPYHETVKAYDEVIVRHKAEIAAMRELPNVPKEALQLREEAMKRAVSTRDAVDRIDFAKAMDGGDDVLYRRWQKAGQAHRAAVRDLDEAMRAPISGPGPSEAATGLVGEGQNLRGLGEFESTALNRAPRVEGQFGMEATNGQGWQPMGRSPMVGKGYTAAAPAMEGAGVTARLPGPRAGIDFEDVSREAKYWADEAAKAAQPADFGASVREGWVPMERPIPGQQGQEFGSALKADWKPMEHAPPGQRGGEFAPHDVGRARGEQHAMPGEMLPDYHESWRPAADETVVARRTPAAAEPAPLPAGEVPEEILDPTRVDAFVQKKVRPLDAADVRVQQAMADLSEKAAGRLESAGGLGILERSGIRPAADNVGAYMDQVYALRKTAKLAAGASNGRRNSLYDALGAALAGAAGHAVGGPLGAMVGVGADLLYLKRGGRIAAASGRLMGRVAGAAEKLLSGGRLRAVAATAAVGSNIAHAYSDRGPIEDPVERIQEVQFLAANPDAIRQRVAENAAELDPQLSSALQERAVNQIQRIAVRAPAILFTKLGEPISPSAGKLRQWFEYENAMHDLGGIIDAIANGSATRPQIDAFRDGFQSVSIKAAAALLVPEKLRDLDRRRLRLVEQVTGVPLTSASDPRFLIRQQQAWAPPAPEQPPQRPQAFNINPAGAPTPAQANASGRAPGN